MHSDILEAGIMQPMEFMTLILDFILHIDRYIEGFVQAYGVWVYALLFLIIFVETGLVVMPFLPGDSLLFVVGAMCGVGLMDYGLSVALLFTAAVAGNQTNYTLGRFFGPKVFAWEDAKWFNRRAFEQAHAFYERYGGVTLVAARFMPFVRTFAPFVAGVAQMTRRKFTFFDVIGGALWVGGIVTAGYLFGNIPLVKANLEKIIWGLILVPSALAAYGSWKASHKPQVSAD
jgi:membrane-associated protein